MQGSTFRMWDSHENQEKYPQSRRQAKGLGQPIVRILGVSALA